MIRYRPGSRLTSLIYGVPSPARAVTRAGTNPAPRTAPERRKPGGFGGNVTFTVTSLVALTPVLVWGRRARTGGSVPGNAPGATGSVVSESGVAFCRSVNAAISLVALMDSEPRKFLVP